MILRNLLGRPGRTMLTLLGIAIGSAAIVALGAMADGMREGYSSMASGSQADLVLTPAGMMDITLGGIPEETISAVAALPEVAAVDGMLIGNIQVEGSPYFFLFGYDPEGFSFSRFRIVEGASFGQAGTRQGKPILLGKEAAGNVKKSVGDTFRVGGTTFRVAGIYESGDSFADSGAVLPLAEAQTLLQQAHRVSMIYIRLDEISQRDAFEKRIGRQFEDLTVSATTEFADRQEMVAWMEAMAWGIAIIALGIGGIGMANTMFMSVIERTREIGLLRAVGWTRGRVLGMILRESLVLALVGGAAGSLLGILAAGLMRGTGTMLGGLGLSFSPLLFLRAFATVIVLGLAGGIYPAWWASQLVPQAALRYDGGGGSVPRFLTGSIALRNLWRRRTRTLLAVAGAAIGIAAVVSLGGIAAGFMQEFNNMASGAQTDIIGIQAGASDMAYSAISDRLVSRITARADIHDVNGIVFGVTSNDQMPFLMFMGYLPQGFAIAHFRIVEGEPLSGPRQALLGRQAATQLHLSSGETVTVGESRYRISGIFETGNRWEDASVVISLRDAQRMLNKPRSANLVGIQVRDATQAEQVRASLTKDFPDLEFSLSSTFSENVADFKRTRQMIQGISYLAILIGAVGALNTMLMTVLERTREIGVLRALGWRRRGILWLILQESLILGVISSVVGILLGIGIGALMTRIPMMGSFFSPTYSPGLFATALGIGVFLGAVGGLYPAWRATRLSPVEALRYE